MKKNCDYCELCMPDGKGSCVCAAHGYRTDNGEDTYGMSYEDAIKLFPNGCDEFEMALSVFIENKGKYNKYTGEIEKE